MADVFLYNLDDLAEMSADNLRQRSTNINDCLAVIQQRAQHLWDWLHQRHEQIQRG
jgi:glutamyl-tRNA reductase